MTFYQRTTVETSYINIWGFFYSPFYYHNILFFQILQVLCAWTHHHSTHIGTTRLVGNRHCFSTQFHDFCKELGKTYFNSNKDIYLMYNNQINTFNYSTFIMYVFFLFEIWIWVWRVKTKCNSSMDILCLKKQSINKIEFKTWDITIKCTAVE